MLRGDRGADRTGGVEFRNQRFGYDNVVWYRSTVVGDESGLSIFNAKEWVVGQMVD